MHVLFRLTVRALLGHWSSLPASLATGVALIILAVNTYAIGALDTVLDDLGEDVTVTAFLSPTLDEPATEGILHRLASRPEISFVAYRSPSAQRTKLSAILGEALVEAIEPQLLPFGAAVAIGITLGQVNTESLARLRADLTTLEGIDGIDAIPWRPDAIEAVSELRAIVGGAGYGVAALLLLLALGMAASWATIAKQRDRALYALLQRFGATAAQEQLPLSVAAAVAGLCAGLAGLIAFHLIIGSFLPVILLLPGAAVPSTSMTWLFFILGGPCLALAGVWLGSRGRESEAWSDG